jgi:Ca2+-binding EF-hand superfamily protein
MISRRPLLASLAVLAVFAATPSFAAGLPKGLDTDNDATIDLPEARKAAGALFDKLEKDHDGTLDTSELRRRLEKGEISAADPDKDGTLTKDEYLAAVEARFKAADPDNDGTLDAKELQSKAGHALLKLLLK